MQSSALLERQHGRLHRRWFAEATIAGFVAIGASTAALLIAFVLANGLADAKADFFRQWLWQLTHNDVVAFSSGRPAVALVLHVVLGLIWALIYARVVESNRSLRWWIGDGPGWSRGMRFALLPWAASLLLLLPAAAINMLDWAFSAGPLVPVGNLVLHLIYGFTLGQLYDSSANDIAVASDLAHEEPLQRSAVEHSEDFGAAGILLGGAIGAAVGIGLAVVLPPTLPNVDFGGWSVALAVGGILAGGAVGAIVGSFAGLPQTPAEPVDIDAPPDPFEHHVMPFLIPLFLLLVIAAVIVTLGTGLLTLGKTQLELGPLQIGAAVVGAIVGIFAIGLGAWFLSSRVDHSSSSSRDTISHMAEH